MLPFNDLSLIVLLPVLVLLSVLMMPCLPVSLIAAVLVFLELAGVMTFGFIISEVPEPLLVLLWLMLLLLLAVILEVTLAVVAAVLLLDTLPAAGGLPV